MHDETSKEEWAASLLQDLLMDSILSGASETQLHPMHASHSINVIPSIGEVPGIAILEDLYPALIEMIKKWVAHCSPVPAHRDYFLGVFHMEAPGNPRYLFVVTIERVPSGGEKVKMARKK